MNQMKDMMGTIARNYKKNASSDYKAEFTSDFNNFYKASESIYDNSSGSGNLGSGAHIYELNFLARKRLGTGYKATYGFAKDALFNWFEPKKADVTQISRVNIPGFKKWQVETNFKNHAIQWDAHKRTFGVGFLIKFWSNHDKMNEPPPRHKPPRAFQVLSPLHIAPMNAWETRYLNYDEEIWNFTGGNLKTQQIHRDRIEVIRGDEQEETWRGLSVLEPIYLPLICYYNAFIFITRGLAKWGNMIPVFHTPSTTPTPTEAADFIDLVQEFVMNGVFIVGKDDKVDFANTNVGTGMFQILELMKEEIAAGLQIPLNVLYERATSGGIGGEGALTAERRYLSQLANEQVNVSDDYINIFDQAGFDFEGRDLDWNMALQKTTEQRLMEQRMKLENDMLEEQYQMLKQENQMLRTQQEMFDKYKDSFTPEQQLDEQERIKEDFMRVKNKFEEYQKLQRIIRGK